MRALLLSTVLLLGVVLAAEEGEREEASYVLTLTEENFEEVVESYSVILVEFYAPW